MQTAGFLCFLEKEMSKALDFLDGFLEYQLYEKGIQEASAEKYKQILIWTVSIIGNMSVFEIDQKTVLKLKKKIFGFSSNYQSLVVSVFKIFMEYLQKFENLNVYNFQMINIPRGRRKPVEYLSIQEIEKIIEKLPEKNISDLRFKALFCLLASSGARINEVLNLKIKDVSLETREALILGKGGRYRKIFFDERANYYLIRYLSKRK